MNLIQLGINKGYVKIEKDKIIYPNGKSYNFSDPEEPIRASTFVELIEIYKYPKERIDTEVYPPRREPKLPADIVVYEDDDNEIAFIVIETKANATKKYIEQAKREGLGNANLLNTKYLWAVCGDKKLAYNIEKHPSTVKRLEKYRIADIPIKYGREPKYRYKRGDPEWDLKRANFNELSYKFQFCHDDIWEGGKRDPAVAFDEMSKILITKLYDERFTAHGKYYKFQIGTYEEPNDVAKRVKEVYEFVQSKNSEVFKAKIELPNYIIFRLVEILQDISLINTDLDIKGRAFENFLGRLFRGEYGQYFTPRPIVEFMVRFLSPDEDDLVIDPACGSGGFLLYSLALVREKVVKKYRDNERTIDRIQWDFAHNQIFGIEINDRIARVAMMDMVIHEDGHSNIECADALQDYRKFDPRKDIKPSKYNILLTNPPFGAVVKDKDILKEFELSSNKERRRTEILFIERCLDLIKPGGKIGIVLPDGVLRNPSTGYVRDFILEKAKILAVISLPSHTFTPSGVPTINTSLLFLQKKESGEHSKTNYPIFMGFAQEIGYAPNGKPTLKEGEETDLDKILECWEAYRDRKKFDSKNTLLINFKDLKERFDARFYWFMRELSKKKFKRIKLKEFIQEIKTKIDPREDQSKFYPILSVTNEGIVIFNEERLGADIRQKYKVVKAGYITYNPYRINVGSIGVVPEELNGMLVSPAYIVMKIKEVDPNYIVAILRHPFYRLYLEVLATGTIRDAVIFNIIKEIEIPDPKKNRDLQKVIIDELERISTLKAEMIKRRKKIKNTIDSLLK